MRYLPPDSDFSLHNLPWGIFSRTGEHPRVGVAIGNHILDMQEVSAHTDLGCPEAVFRQPVLNPFISLGKTITRRARSQVRRWLTEEQASPATHPRCFVDRLTATLHLPVQIGDYTDFYASREHATNVGKLFRDPENALLPNWRHLPVAYHGRASSIVVSGTPIHRPSGQVFNATTKQPEFQATGQLDFELETAFIIGKNSSQGKAVPIQEAEHYIFGLVLFNDWSARDIQRWEYVPLGPFLGKNFASTISPWVVPLEALEPFRVSAPRQEPAVLSYLQTTQACHFDLNLSVTITPPGGVPHQLTRSNTRYLYWGMSQQLAHHTVNGCNLRVGDLLASGTISSPTPNGMGSLLEITRSGQIPITLPNGQQRTFLADGDEITLSGWGQRGEIRVGFGEAKGRILPAFPPG